MNRRALYKNVNKWVDQNIISEFQAECIRTFANEDYKKNRRFAITLVLILISILFFVMIVFILIN
jgi:hypothetical protein